VTLRDNTERPVTCALGTNRLAGTNPLRVKKVLDEVLSAPPVASRTPPGWDGKAAERIVEVLCGGKC
jgi:UDP-N-acetylglucosamine 2-epimerase (non-hydrolysing)